MAAATKIASLEDLHTLAGRELGVSDWVTLAFEDILRFADATGDHQWIHVDRERAKNESPFGAPVAHGYYGISRIAGLFKEIVDTSECALVLNYGINKARFPNALKEGARYRLSLRLGEVKAGENTADTVFVATIEIDGQDRPACVAEVVYRFAFA